MEKLTESFEFNNGEELAGFVVKHSTFGIGTIISNEGDRIQINFQNNETKWFLAFEADLTIISKSEQEESISVSDNLKEHQVNNKELEERLERLEGKIELEIDLKNKERFKRERYKKEIEGFLVLFAIVAFLIFAATL